MVSTSEALIAVSDSILNSFTSLSKLEYNKKGRVYRYVNNDFQRIREEDKHLVIYPQDLSMNMAQISAFNILSNISDGRILETFPDFCCAILGIAKQLEVNNWYEIENTSVVNYQNCKFDPLECKDECEAWLNEHTVTDDHISAGIDLMICSKLNFLHTDHHIGTKIEGYYMKHYLSKFNQQDEFNKDNEENEDEAFSSEDILHSSDVLVALKSFVHWGNIKGILYKLDVPNINISEELRHSFADFPDPSPELKLSVYDRYPSGTSKYSLIRKSIDILGDWHYSKLIPFPPSSDQDIQLNWLYELCHDIEKNPLKYHLRSLSKSLYIDPINLNELSQMYSQQCKTLLSLVSILLNTFIDMDTGGEYLLNNSKIPKFDDKFVSNNRIFYDKLIEIRELIQSYETKGWDKDDIVLRLQGNKDLIGESTLFDKVMEMREKFIDDYE
ncbi:uncharacterized protein RJT21DRAFT_125083 [Scheffersomyces amazonensis]|uniref:uncharacterized protein n=1 Tax=Scheffersomyces amazonensis TaxID=1078765 RepID=UPI00315DF526